VGLLFSVFVAGVVVVHGHSMEPTLHNDERVLVVRTGAWLERLGAHPFAPGDIVFFPDPTRARAGLGRLLSQHLLIKRIVAGPGQHVGMRAGALYVDGRTRPEPYLVGAFRGLGSVPATQVPRGHVYVMGDNRRPTASFDSRSFGPVPSASIEGRAVLVVWPLFRRTASGWRWNVRALTAPAAGAAPVPTGRRSTAAR
jgi:signal peptidase I